MDCFGRSKSAPAEVANDGAGELSQCPECAAREVVCGWFSLCVGSVCWFAGGHCYVLLGLSRTGRLIGACIIDLGSSADVAIK